MFGDGAVFCDTGRLIQALLGNSTRKLQVKSTLTIQWRP